MAEAATWYFTGSLVEKSLGQNGHDNVCLVQGNSNQQNYPAYSIHCDYNKFSKGSDVAAVCCYW